ncbi:hypothetical protein TcG_08579 [Trypanosoma cruzi]|nr:hypothetical protein TcBrA4_0138910 [Trypanosoma cruzi]PBJ69460.1 hypothetical protein BCY84_19752 [Trypanosoma cruzi cruzi]PBJ70932.1 hypothetical protein BCY84_17778 [Trypanosoma cruzi cruzi]RNF13465.1 hypothetical protein TcG_08579 [Trypanosoma cruzi]
MFCLRDVMSQLPGDGATKWIKIENVISPMSSADVVKLFPEAVSWNFTSHVQRTDYVVSFPNESVARIAMRRVEGLSFLGEKMDFSFLFEDNKLEKPLPLRMTSSYPRLYFLPPEVSYQSRCDDADRIVSSVGITLSSSQDWVNAR